MKITAAVISYNEAGKISNCLKSLNWADEIIIIDSNSTDGTTTIAKEYTSKIYLTDTDLPYYRKRELALKHAENDWIFFLDCDEYADHELIRSIQSIKEISGSDNSRAYRINRKNLYMNKWVKRGGLYPDYQLRLFNRNYAGITPRLIHEGVEIKGEIKTLNGHIIHRTVDDIEQMINKINLYSTLQARQWQNEGKNAGNINVLLNPLAMFLKTYFIKKAFLDGMEGFLASFNYTFVNFLSYLKLLRLQNVK